MDLSVVVPTLNAREDLRNCLDALATHADDVEVIVVNGPSSDGTTGMVRDRTDVDVLVEVSDRNGNAARNAGIEVARGDAIAIVDSAVTIESSWREAVGASLAAGADVVTGPVRHGSLPELARERESLTAPWRSVTVFNGSNVVFTAETLESLDGFDEYLVTDAERDASYRLAGLEYDVTWNAEMRVSGGYEADGGESDGTLGDSYRCRAYRLAKNYGLRPSVVFGTFWRAFRDSITGVRDVTRGKLQPTGWFRTGQTVLKGIATGTVAGFRARRADRTPRRNPNGVSTRHDRAVERYDWRE